MRCNLRYAVTESPYRIFSLRRLFLVTMMDWPKRGSPFLKMISTEMNQYWQGLDRLDSRVRQFCRKISTAALQGYLYSKANLWPTRWSCSILSEEICWSKALKKFFMMFLNLLQASLNFQIHQIWEKFPIDDMDHFMPATFSTWKKN